MVGAVAVRTGTSVVLTRVIVFLRAPCGTSGGCSVLSQEEGAKRRLGEQSALPSPAPPSPEVFILGCCISSGIWAGGSHL